MEFGGKKRRREQQKTMLILVLLSAVIIFKKKNRKTKMSKVQKKNAINEKYTLKKKGKGKRKTMNE